MINLFLPSKKETLDLGVWVHNDGCCGVLSDIDRWSEIRQSVKPPYSRHKIDQIAKTQAKTKNTVVSSKVDMNKDIELIRQGLGTPKEVLVVKCKLKSMVELIRSMQGEVQWNLID